MIFVITVLLLFLSTLSFVVYLFNHREEEKNLKNLLWLKTLGFTFLGSAFVISLLGLFVWIPPKVSIFTILATTLIGIYLFTLTFFRKGNLNNLAAVVSSTALLFSLLGLSVGTFPLKEHLLMFHVGVSLLTFSLLLLSAVFSFLRILSEKNLKQGNLNLPLNIPLSVVVKLERRLFFFGFVFLTVELILSLLWSQARLGEVVFDSRVCATLLLWLYYNLLFHLERFGFSFFRRYFSHLNLFGAILIVLSLLLTRHRF